MDIESDYYLGKGICNYSMGKINHANLKKAYYYLKRNGVKNTWYAAKERLEERKAATYEFIPSTEEELTRQREVADKYRTTFSIVVPTYRTKEQYLRELITCLQKQSYPAWELVLADATEDDSVERIVRAVEAEGGLKVRYKEDAGEECKVAESNSMEQDDFRTGSILYVGLAANAGIAENTNRALAHASGQYIGLLDHDDVLTKNALFEMAEAIEKGKEAGVEVRMLYSDEDKCDGERTQYYEPNIKEDFNLDLLLSNNYICHFLVLESVLMKALGFRKEYDGAQDYDLVLRAAEKLMHQEEQIVHIPKVLYHWRCHTGSTAENPQSKQYAYEAGLRALQDFAKRQGWNAVAKSLKHLGFYTLMYQDGPLKARKDIGAVGGRILKKGKTAGGRMSAKGELFYKDLPAPYSGYLHRAVLTQDAEALDIRCLSLREECWQLFEQVTGVSYQTIHGEELFDCSLLPEGTDYMQISLALSKVLREQGYRLLYLPDITVNR